VIIGVHQRTAPVAVREHVAFSQATIHSALLRLGEYVQEGFIISTCNRVEVGGLAPDAETGKQALRRFLLGCHDMPEELLDPHLSTYVGLDAVRHLFHLSAGLDSMVLGEEQIMGQVKRALTAAHDSGTLGPALHRLLEHALSVGKLVRTQTGIARNHVSVVSVAVDLARQTLGSLVGQRILIIGAGKMGELAIKNLQGESPLAIGVISRTPAKAHSLAERYDAVAWEPDELETAIRASDVVISCTSATGLVIDAGMAERASAGRTQPLLLLDLAVPRDVEPSAGDLPNVQLFDVDGMQQICNANRVARASEIAAAEALVEIEVRKFMEWWSAQQVVPTIKALRERAEAIRAAELQRALARLPELSPREQETIQALSAAIVNKLLHQPIAALKDPTLGSQMAQSVQKLFQLESMRESHAVES
jgi:glutamyl-tRNA reductase